MLIKLSPKQRNPKSREEYGSLWISSENIVKMEQRIGWNDTGNPNGYERKVWYLVTFSGDMEQILDETQFEELMCILPAPMDGVASRKRIEIIKRMGANAWHALSDDEQYDLVYGPVLAEESKHG